MFKMIRLTNSCNAANQDAFGTLSSVLHFFCLDVFCSQKYYTKALTVMDPPLNFMEVFSQLTNEYLMVEKMHAINFAYVSALLQMNKPKCKQINMETDKFHVSTELLSFINCYQ